MRKLTLLLGLILLVGLAFVEKSFATSGFKLDISVGLINHDPSGELQYPVPEGDRINLKKDLRFNDKSRIFGRVKLEHPIPLTPNLYFQYMPMKFSGSSVLNRSIKFGDTTYSSNAALDSEVKLDRFDVGLYDSFKFLSDLVPLVTLIPELGVNLRIMNFKGSIRGQDPQLGEIKEESKSVTIPIPMAYGALDVSLSKIPISFRGEVRILPVSEVRYYDWSLEGRVKPSKAIPVYLSVGYRHEQLKIKDVSNVYIDIKIKGPFIMLGVNF